MKKSDPLLWAFILEAISINAEHVMTVTLFQPFCFANYLMSEVASNPFLMGMFKSIKIILYEFKPHDKHFFLCLNFKNPSSPFRAVSQLRDFYFRIYFMTKWLKGSSSTERIFMQHFDEILFIFYHLLLNVFYPSTLICISCSLRSSAISSSGKEFNSLLKPA